jgi:hypothetical protein
MSPAEQSAQETYRRCADRCVELSAENQRLREAPKKDPYSIMQAEIARRKAAEAAKENANG